METKTIFNNQGRQHMRQGLPKKGKGRSQPAKKKKGDSLMVGFFRLLMALIIMLVLYFAWTAYRVQRGDRY